MAARVGPAVEETAAGQMEMETPQMPLPAQQILAAVVVEAVRQQDRVDQVL
jgi:hypothetical protein